jgi:hypothetical protein
MSTPDTGPGTDVSADLDDLGEHERPASSDPAEQRDDLPADSQAVGGEGDDDGGTRVLSTDGSTVEQDPHVVGRGDPVGPADLAPLVRHDRHGPSALRRVRDGGVSRR